MHQMLRNLHSLAGPEDGQIVFIHPVGFRLRHEVVDGSSEQGRPITTQQLLAGPVDAHESKVPGVFDRDHVWNIVDDRLQERVRLRARLLGQHLLRQILVHQDGAVDGPVFATDRHGGVAQGFSRSIRTDNVEGVVERGFAGREDAAQCPAVQFGRGADRLPPAGPVGRGVQSNLPDAGPDLPGGRVRQDHLSRTVGTPYADREHVEHGAQLPFASLQIKLRVFQFRHVLDKGDPMGDGSGRLANRGRPHFHVETGTVFTDASDPLAIGPAVLARFFPEAIAFGFFPWRDPW